MLLIGHNMHYQRRLSAFGHGHFSAAAFTLMLSLMISMQSLLEPAFYGALMLIFY